MLFTHFIDIFVTDMNKKIVIFQIDC